MVREQTRALVSYDARKNSAQQNQDYTVALRCAHALMQKGVEVEVRGYDDSDLKAETNWLIVIYSDTIKPPAHIVNVVDKALNRVVERSMRDVMIFTPSPSDVRSEWASIRKYDVSSSGKEDAALSSMLQAMESVKLPYTQALNQQKHHVRRKGQQKAPSVLQLAALVATIVVVLLAVVGSVIYLPGYLHPVSTTAAATALARATLTRSTGTVSATQTIPGVSAATQKAKQKDLSTLTKGTPPTIQEFQAANQWDTPVPTSLTSCALANNTYTVNISTANQYMPCLAAQPAFTNLVMQVTMKIQGDAGGIIFRSNSVSKAYYRLAVNQSDATTPTIDTFSLIRCNKDCNDNSVDSGTPLMNNTNSPVNVDRKQPITLTLIARVNTFDVFIDGRFVASITDSNYTAAWSGQIGVYAASLGKDTTVTFSNLKVWSLSDHPPTQPSGKPTSQPTPPP